MSEAALSIPLDALFCAPHIQRWYVRILEAGRDVTPEPDHAANRRSCRLANEKNAEQAARFRFKVRPPHYHYDALGGRAIYTPPAVIEASPLSPAQPPPPAT